MNPDNSILTQKKYDQAIRDYVINHEGIDEEFKSELLIAFVYFLEIKMSRRPRNKAQEADIIELRGMNNAIYVGLLKVLDFEDDVIQIMWNDVVD